MKNKVAIIGHGYVGKGMSKIFPGALVYEPTQKKGLGYIEDNGDIHRPFDIKENEIGLLKKVNFSDKEEINKECGMAIICVPTPPVTMDKQEVKDDEDRFLEVDLSIIEDVFSWLKVPLVLIKSTVPPGTTDMLKRKYGHGLDTIQPNEILDNELEENLALRRICFSPEYMGEGKYYVPPKYPDPTNPMKHEFMVIGGSTKDCDDILDYFIRKMGPAKRYIKVTAVEAELVKYMENTWGATKVTFCNTWYDICKTFGASYNSVREALLADSRVEQMHTAVFPDKRGFGGKCYPKDLLGIIAQCEKKGYSPDLLKEVWEVNRRYLKMNKDAKND